MADVVVLLPGITGSVLRDSAGRDVWAPTAGAAARALVTLGRSITDLELCDGDADDGVTAPLMVPDLHLIPGLWKIDGYSKLSRYVQQEFAVTPGRNFFTFPYDWRRDNRVAARRLKEQADRWLWQWRNESPDAKLILVGHSMGGLVARYFLECLDGWRDTRRLVTFGTPYRGSLNALNFLVHGMQKRLGPVPVLDLSRLLRSFPSIYQLLPIYPCVAPGNGKLIRVSEAAGLPHVDPERAQAADVFHREIEQAVTAHLGDEEYRRGRYTIHPIVGTFQSTLLSARLSGDSVQVLGTYPGFEPDGDGTVPRVSATPIEFPHEEGAMFAAERHGSLQHNDGVLVQLAGLLSGQDTSAVRAGTDAGLALDDAFGPGEPVTFRFRAADPMARLIAVVTAVRTGVEVARLELGAAGDWRDGGLAPPPPGAYRLTLAGDGVEPVTDVFVVVGEKDPTETGEVRTRGGLQVRSVYAKGGYEVRTKRPYQKPVLTRLGLLRELTKYSDQNGWLKRVRSKAGRGTTAGEDQRKGLIISSAPAGDAGVPVPERRLLQGRFPERVRLGEEVTLLVRLGLQPGARLETELAPLAVPEAGLEVVLLLVDSAGFTLRSPERQAVRVFPRQDSSWAAFELQAAGEGVHALQVEAFVGGTGLGGLAVQVSVDPGTPTSLWVERSSPAALALPDEGKSRCCCPTTPTGRYTGTGWSTPAATTPRRPPRTGCCSRPARRSSSWWPSSTRWPGGRRAGTPRPPGTGCKGRASRCGTASSPRPCSGSSGSAGIGSPR